MIDQLTKLLSIIVLFILYSFSFKYVSIESTEPFALLLLLFLHVSLFILFLVYSKTGFSVSNWHLLKPLFFGLSKVFPITGNSVEKIGMYFFPTIFVFSWFFLFLGLCYLIDTLRRLHIFNHTDDFHVILGKRNLLKLQSFEFFSIFTTVLLWLFFFLSFFNIRDYIIPNNNSGFNVIIQNMIKFLQFLVSLFVFICCVLLIVFSLNSFIQSFYIYNSFHFIPLHI